jgi:hypothetical protein|eukprot:SAG25_NODE_1555_length_2770_cov_38.636459_2_plen_108_part_00
MRKRERAVPVDADCCAPLRLPGNCRAGFRPVRAESRTGGLRWAYVRLPVIVSVNIPRGSLVTSVPAASAGQSRPPLRRQMTTSSRQAQPRVHLPRSRGRSPSEQDTA